ncbi:NAD(P)-binding protein [Aaosphaeria arxii CBS 175.79]|uniref:NAD(P)-binding protein n=1 Tax=Aaosphaeria arxii CBS 175.79 TaxID=1450172 RepID=A0A6A5Y0T5_9PLEO|nr:NAD(P)-binding protein [Aaosphaeria arxii CBS 175.79]KAF2019165.1 NAD(P)-binding protein [Aaosphaeria arxii CBS 175.79]
MKTTLDFTGRNIAITGGCSGIGFALAQTLIALGATVYIADIVKNPPAELVDHDRIHITYGCDITKRDACKSFIDSIPGRLDGLVNCAGTSTWEGKIGSDEVYQRTMDINVNGTWNMGTEAMRRMSGQEDVESPGAIPGVVRNVGQGAIVNVGSGASLRGVSGLAAYSASKHAILGLTRSWARDFPKLRVNAVAPGATDTPLAEATVAAAPTGDTNVIIGKAQIASIPKGRMAYATDIADAVVFLLSDWSSFITGQCLPVNGGNF